MYKVLSKVKKSRLISNEYLKKKLRLYTDKMAFDTFFSKRYVRYVRTQRKTYPFSIFLHFLITRAISNRNYWGMSTRQDWLPCLLSPGFSYPGPYFLFFFIWLTFLSFKITMMSYLLQEVISESIKVGNFFLLLRLSHISFNTQNNNNSTGSHFMRS